MLSEINHRKRRHVDNENYPLGELTKGKKISNQDLIITKELLESSTLSMAEIARQYNVTSATIRGINKGISRHNDN